MRNALTEILQQGSRELLAAALKAEIQAYLEDHAGLRDADGRHRVVRNGYLPEREVQPGIGPIPVRQPRVRDRRASRGGCPRECEL